MEELYDCNKLDLELGYNESTGQWEEIHRNYILEISFEEESEMELFKKYMEGFSEFVRSHKNMESEESERSEDV